MPPASTGAGTHSEPLGGVHHGPEVMVGDLRGPAEGQDLVEQGGRRPCHRRRWDEGELAHDELEQLVRQVKQRRL